MIFTKPTLLLFLQLKQSVKRIVRFNINYKIFKKSNIIEKIILNFNKIMIKNFLTYLYQV